jgi:hypothetical protein
MATAGYNAAFAAHITSGAFLGAFYTNITVRAASPDVVVPLLQGRRAFLTPAHGGYITIYEEQCDEGGLYPNEFASHLSQALGSVAFLVTVHDDDILYVDTFERGERLDEYDSCPNYFSEEDEEDAPPEGGNPAVLCSTFGCGDEKAVADVLYCQDEDSPIWVFATERHRALVKLLGLPEFAVGYGYKYLAQGEVPQELRKEELIEIRP